MKVKDQLKQLRNMRPRELIQELQLDYQKLRKSNFSIKFRKQKNIKETRQIKQKIARIWTILNAKIVKESQSLAATK